MAAAAQHFQEIVMLVTIVQKIAAYRPDNSERHFIHDPVQCRDKSCGALFVCPVNNSSI